MNKVNVSLDNISKKAAAYYIVDYQGNIVGPYRTRDDARHEKLDGEKIVQLKPSKFVR